MTDLCFCKHYKKNGRCIIEHLDISHMQAIIHVLHRQQIATDLTALDDKPQPNGCQYE
jgi:hypothetical protein